MVVLPSSIMMQDAHNLAWKLAACVSGIASPSLLKTYESERAGVARANTQLSIDNFEDALQVPRAIGLAPEAAAFATSAFSRLQGWLPSGRRNFAVASSARRPCPTRSKTDVLSVRIDILSELPPPYIYSSRTGIPVNDIRRRQG
jgi:hypothetical protein